MSREEPTVVIEPHRGLFDLDLQAVWQYRELLYFLVWRDIKIRYKQTVIGIAWAVLQPLVQMVIFSVVFGRFAKMPSDGLPYAVFAYSALLPWNYFATALNRCAQSVVADSNMISKIYFPRLILPLAGTSSGFVDFFVSFLLLLAMLAWYEISLTLWILTVPLFLMFAQLTALAVGLWLSALNVRYRDIGHTVPFIVQIWMFASPIVYPLSLIPEKWRMMVSLNPMVGVIEGFRWALLGKVHPDLASMATSFLVVIALLLGGLVFFKNMERTFADVV